MKFAADRPFADPEKAARKLLEIANTVEAVQDGRIYIELLNGPFLFSHSGSPAEFGASLALAIERGWLWQGVTARDAHDRHEKPSLCTFAPFSRAIGVIVDAVLDPKQCHKLLRGDRTKDASWVRAAIEHLMAADPNLNLDEIEDVLRAAASTAYLVSTAEGFEVVVGFTAWHDALAKAGMTAEQNRLALAVPTSTG